MVSAYRIDPGSLHPGTLAPPPSKSDAQRALILGHVLERREPAALWAMREERLPADVRVVRRAIESFEEVGPAGEVAIDCGDGGAPFRFLLTQAALRPGVTVFTGSPRLGQRPHAPLLAALRQALGPAGLRIDEGRPWPVTVHGASGPVVDAGLTVDAAQSGQFVSSLLLGAARLVLRERRPWTVRTAGAVASGGYVDLTLSWLERAGFEVKRSEGSFVLTGHRDAGPLPDAPGDWSSLGYLLPIAWAAGARVRHVDPNAEHPDRAILRALAQAGLTVSFDGNEATVGGTATSGVSATGAESPDLLPTLAALACVLPAPSTLERVDILRDKESDRLAGIEALVSAAGGRTAPQGANGLLIEPPAKVRPFRLHSRGDHRMAMSAATLAVLGRVSVEIEDPLCVEKSFPGFYDALRAVGCAITELP